MLGSIQELFSQAYAWKSIEQQATCPYMFSHNLSQYYRFFKIQTFGLIRDNLGNHS